MSNNVVTVRRNVIANYIGAAWSALIGLAFVPLYVRYLGIEAYGLIGIFTLLQSWLAILDLGLTPTISREMARYTAGQHTAQSIRELLTSVERVYFGIAAIVPIVVSACAHALSIHWVRAERLPVTTVADALMITGLVISARWLIGFYRSALVGLQKQVWLNCCSVIFATTRGIVTAAILVGFSRSILVFFMVQGLLIGLEVVVVASKVKGLLPTPPAYVQFQWNALRNIWRFASGMAVITLLSILLMQVDKLLLSTLVSLTDFGYYALATTVASALTLLIAPINNAIYPQLVDMVAREDMSALSDAYHRYSQLLTLMLVPAACVLTICSYQILVLWTGDLTTSQHVAPLVGILAIGYMLNGLMHIPYTLQLAYGWTRFMVVVNSISVVLVIPLLYVGIRVFGMLAAAYVWILLNAAYIFIAVPVMHRKLLPREMWTWYRIDVLTPMAASITGVEIVKALASPASVERGWRTALFVVSAAAAAVIAAWAATPLGRRYTRAFLPFA